MHSYEAYDLTYKTGVSSLELEKAINQDWFYSFCYANYILKGRFKLGELMMHKNRYFDSYYDYLVKAMRYNHE